MLKHKFKNNGNILSGITISESIKYNSHHVMSRKAIKTCLISSTYIIDVNFITKPQSTLLIRFTVIEAAHRKLLRHRHQRLALIIGTISIPLHSNYSTIDTDYQKFGVAF